MKFIFVLWQTKNESHVYSHNPLPGLCAQAVYFVFWSFLVFGAMNISPHNYDSMGWGGFLLVRYIFKGQLISEHISSDKRCPITHTANVLSAENTDVCL